MISTIDTHTHINIQKLNANPSTDFYEPQEQKKGKF